MKDKRFSRSGLSVAEVDEMIAETQRLQERVAELEAKINTPEIGDFLEGVKLEAAHQRERWGSDHDEGKSSLDWFWLIGYLSQKIVVASVEGDVEKQKHHCISTAAAMFNWYCAIAGVDNRMRPGIKEPT